MFVLTAQKLGHGTVRAGPVGSGIPPRGWNFIFPLSIFCPAFEGAAGDRVLSSACRGVWVLERYWDLHDISMTPLGLLCYHSCVGPLCIFSLGCILRGNIPFVWKIFFHLPQQFWHGRDGIGNQEFQVILVLSWYLSGCCFLLSGCYYVLDGDVPWPCRFFWRFLQMRSAVNPIHVA